MAGIWRTDIKSRTVYEGMCPFCSHTFEFATEPNHRARAKCENCGAKGSVERTRYDHKVTWAIPDKEHNP